MATYPETDPAGGTQKVYCSLDFPVRAAEVPAVWVDYEASTLKIAGIDYTETDAEGNLLTRWRFEGYVTFTVIAMTSNECDLIYDELVSLIAFAAQSEAPNAFRTYVESAPLVATNWSFDTIEGRASGPSIGTPWGTDEVIYERGIAIQALGEFLTNPVTLNLVPLSEIRVIATDTAPIPDTQEIDVIRNAADDPGLEPGGRFGL